MTWRARVQVISGGMEMCCGVGANDWITQERRDLSPLKTSAPLAAPHHSSPQNMNGRYWYPSSVTSETAAHSIYINKMHSGKREAVHLRISCSLNCATFCTGFSDKAHTSIALFQVSVAGHVFSSNTDLQGKRKSTFQMSRAATNQPRVLITGPCSRPPDD